MVKIDEHRQAQDGHIDHSNVARANDQSDNQIHKGVLVNGTKSTLKMSDLPEANLALVEHLRSQLREHYGDENSDRVGVGKYSPAHLDDILDPESPNTCWRYLLQRDCDVDAAFELAKATLAWRHENRIDQMSPRDMIKDFWLRAPIGLVGKTKNGNDLFYAIGKNFVKPDPSVRQQVRGFVAYLLFDWDTKHKHDLEQFELVFDVSESGFKNIDLDFSQWLVSIRDFVPARIKAIYFVGIPFLIRPIIRLIISWLPERFKRIAYCGTYDELVRANITDESIPEEIGGKADNKWRLAPPESKWAYELNDPEAKDMFEKICQACNSNSSQDYLDKVYQMQRDYERNLLSKDTNVDTNARDLR